jgi:HPr kinase/phosphorylase
MFGISAIRDRKKLQLVVKLVIWENDVEYDRIGLEEHTYRILGVDLPLIVLPVRPGRTLSTIVEVAARNHLLKLEGFHAAKEFQQKLLAKLTADAESQAEEPE